MNSNLDSINQINEHINSQVNIHVLIKIGHYPSF